MLALTILKFIGFCATVGASYYGLRLALVGLSRTEAEFSALRSRVNSKRIFKFVLFPVTILMAVLAYVAFVLGLAFAIEQGKLAQVVPSDTRTGAFLACMNTNPVGSDLRRHQDIEPNPIREGIRSEECLENLDLWYEPIKTSEQEDHNSNFFKNASLSFIDFLVSLGKRISSYALSLISIPIFFFIFMILGMKYPVANTDEETIRLRQDVLAKCFSMLSYCFIVQFFVVIIEYEVS